jgi:maltose alpha-D-glucosyltransferase/alpha-amylase
LPEIGRGRLVLLETDNPSVFAHACELRGRGVAAVHNLGDEPCTFTLTGFDHELHAETLPRDREYGELDLSRVELGPYGYRWLRFGAHE